MQIIDPIQNKLSHLQAIPVAGPLIFSPVKTLISTAQIVAGLGAGILFGATATTTLLAFGPNKVWKRLFEASFEGFWLSTKGFGSLCYACGNMATLGLLGMSVRQITPSDQHAG